MPDKWTDTGENRNVILTHVTAAGIRTPTGPQGRGTLRLVTSTRRLRCDNRSPVDNVGRTAANHTARGTLLTRLMEEHRAL
jgi:hypothetical protein